MTHRKTEEQRFTEAFYAELVANPDKAPGPAGIARRMGLKNTRDLNGRCTFLRTAALEAAGFVKDEETNRWNKKEQP